MVTYDLSTTFLPFNKETHLRKRRKILCAQYKFLNDSKHNVTCNVYVNCNFLLNNVIVEHTCYVTIVE